MRSMKKLNKPTVLVENEMEWTKSLTEYVNNGEKPPDNIKNKYRHPEIKKILLEETFNKCVYCESKITHIEYGDIEHIDPKSKVHDKTFEWENLTISCSKCNTNKSDYYDPTFSLLNPYKDNPESKITFLGPITFPVGGDPRAEFTIRLLKLDRAELVERRTEHLNKIKPLLLEFERASTPLMKQLIWEDIKLMMNIDKEFSLLTKSHVSFLSPVAI